MTRTPLVLALATAAALPLAAQASPALDQYATKVLGFSTQYSTDRFAAKQALKAPDTTSYGDIATSWAPSSTDAGAEYISLSYTTPVYATGATIRETYGWGFVVSIDAIDSLGGVHTVWQGTDDSLPNQINDFTATWPQTTYAVTGLTVHIDTSLHGGWEEIDSVQLHGVQPLGGTIAPLLGHSFTLTCTNVKTGQTVTGTVKGKGTNGAATQFDCQAIGLTFSANDQVTMQVKGKIAP